MTMSKIVKAVAAAALLAVSATAAWADKIVVSNWDGYMPKDIAEKFKANFAQFRNLVKPEVAQAGP